MTKISEHHTYYGCMQEVKPSFTVGDVRMKYLIQETLEKEKEKFKKELGDFTRDFRTAYNDELKKVTEEMKEARRLVFKLDSKVNKLMKENNLKLSVDAMNEKKVPAKVQKK